MSFNPPLEDVQETIRTECTKIAEMLCEKNEAYGNAVCNPIAIFSKASPLEQIQIRIDDKLARIQRSDANALGEDAVFDMIGYLILYRVYDKLLQEQTSEMS